MLCVLFVIVFIMCILCKVVMWVNGVLLWKVLRLSCFECLWSYVNKRFARSTASVWLNLVVICVILFLVLCIVIKCGMFILIGVVLICLSLFEFVSFYVMIVLFLDSITLCESSREMELMFLKLFFEFKKKFFIWLIFKVLLFRFNCVGIVCVLNELLLICLWKLCSKVEIIISVVSFSFSVTYAVWNCFSDMFLVVCFVCLLNV